MANEPDHGGRLTALESLRELLLEERTALKARDHDAILDCARRKATRAAELQHLLPAATALATAAPAERERIAEVTSQCQELNRANGMLVVALRGVVDRALGVLLGDEGGERSAVYGPGGNRLAAAAARYAGSA